MKMPEDVLPGMSSGRVLTALRVSCPSCDFKTAGQKILVHGFSPSRFGESGTTLEIIQSSDVILGATVYFHYDTMNAAQDSYAQLVAAQSEKDWKTIPNANCITRGFENRRYAICLGWSNKDGFTVGMSNRIQGFHPDRK